MTRHYKNEQKDKCVNKKQIPIQLDMLLNYD